jgi:hypothetical protein
VKKFDWTPVFTGVTNEFQFFHSFRGGRGDFFLIGYALSSILGWHEIR